MEELIIIKQLPIIEERLKALSDEVKEKAAYALSLDVTEESVKEVKKVRAELNKEFADLEARKKQVKDAVMAPYQAFEAIYNECVADTFKATDKTLKGNIDEVEDELKNQKRAEVVRYFGEYSVAANLNWLRFDDAGIKIGLSDSIKSLKDKAKAHVDRVYSDVTMIETQENTAEIMTEYRKTLDASGAITTVKRRHEAIEQEKQRQVEMEERKKAQAEAAARVEAIVPPVVVVEPLQPAKVETPPVVQELNKLYTIAFKITDTKDALATLSQYLKNQGYEYTQIPLKNILEG